MSAEGNFTVKVTKKEVVSAVLPLQEHWLAQSNLDLLLPPLDVSVFFCYKKPLQSGLTFGSMVTLLKESLAKALVYYYALAGELMENSVGEPELLCNNRGVDFVEAYAQIELRHLNLFNPDDSIEGKLVPVRKQGVLSIQVTELKCGAIVVACTFDHCVADAYSANMFLVSWAEISQSKPISVFRLILTPRHPRVYSSSLDDMYIPVSSLPPPKNTVSFEDQLISRIFYIKLNQLDALQSLANEHNDVSERKKLSKLESFCAYLWKMTSGVVVDDEKICKMGIVVDGRTRLSDGETEKTKLMKNYFGNVLSIPYGSEKAGNLKSRPLSCVAEAVHKFLDSAVTKEHFLELIDWVEAHRPEPACAKIYAAAGDTEDNGPAVVVSSGQRFPVSKVDFGWGKPMFGSYHFPWGGESGYVMPMPSPLGNGDWIVYMHLFKQQLDFIEEQAGHVFRPITFDYLEDQN